MHSINNKFPSLEQYTQQIDFLIKEINDSPHLNEKQKKDAIKALEIHSSQEMARFVNSNFKRPVDTDNVHTKDESQPLAESIKEIISENRPKEFKGDKSKKHDKKK